MRKSHEVGVSFDEELMTLDEVKAEARIRYESDYNSKEWHRFPNGWMSTSKKTPLKGQVFLPVKDGAVVEFTNKFGHTNRGVVYQVSFLDTARRAFPVVLTTGNVNALIGWDELTVLEGALNKPFLPLE